MEPRSYDMDRPWSPRPEEITRLQADLCVRQVNDLTTLVAILMKWVIWLAISVALLYVLVFATWIWG